MTPPPADDTSGKSGRRTELLDIAATLFAERGLRATTVRDIADAAGILSGSLYHHFDSKESMVDEILRGFLDELLARYREIVASGLDSARDPRRRWSPRRSRRSTRRTPRSRSTRTRQAARRQRAFRVPRRAQHRVPRAVDGCAGGGVAGRSFRADIDVELAYRFLRDTVWVAVRWYRPGGPLTAETVARQYLSMVLDGIASPDVTLRFVGSCHGRGLHRRSGPHARRQDAAAACPACIPPTSARTCIKALVERSRASTRPPSTTSSSAASTRSGPQAGNIARTAGWPPATRGGPGVTVDRQCGSTQQAVHFARAGDPERHRRPGRRRRRAEHEPDPDRLGDDRRSSSTGSTTPFARLDGLGGPLRGPGGVAVPRRRTDRREVGHQPRGHGAVRAAEPRAGAARPSTRAASSGRSCRSAT